MDISRVVSIEKSGINVRTIGQFSVFYWEVFFGRFWLVQIQNDFEIQGINNEIESQTSHTTHKSAENAEQHYLPYTLQLFSTTATIFFHSFLYEQRFSHRLL